MKNNLIILCGAAIITSFAACTSSPTSLRPGEYTKTQKSVNEAGTETTKTTNTKVYYDENGNKRAVQEVETTKDPEGLFNKTTSSSTKTYD